MGLLNNILSISCKESAMLSAKASIDGLSYFEKIKMRFHAKICPPCEHYDKDNEAIDKAISKLTKAGASENIKLSLEQKEKIKQALH